MNQTIVAILLCYWQLETVCYPREQKSGRVHFPSEVDKGGSAEGQKARVLSSAAAGHKACVKLLLDEGADIEQRNVVSIYP
jgi:hypothetical protein